MQLNFKMNNPSLKDEVSGTKTKMLTDTQNPQRKDLIFNYVKNQRFLSASKNRIIWDSWCLRFIDYQLNFEDPIPRSALEWKYPCR